MRRILVVVVLCVIACNSPAQPPDAAVDARSDAMTFCTDYPELGFRRCPSYQPYCCAFGPEYMLCSADSRMGTCTEHPIDDIRQPCDRTTGDGCPADHPVCCAIDTFTFCVDHVLVGPSWQCSP